MAGQAVVADSFGGHIPQPWCLPPLQALLISTTPPAAEARRGVTQGQGLNPETVNPTGLAFLGKEGLDAPLRCAAASPFAFAGFAFGWLGFCWGAGGSPCRPLIAVSPDVGMTGAVMRPHSIHTLWGRCTLEPECERCLPAGIIGGRAIGMRATSLHASTNMRPCLGAKGCRLGMLTCCVRQTRMLAQSGSTH